MKKFLLVIFAVIFISGCLQGVQTPDSDLEVLAETIQTLSAANTTSAPVNPYAFPIGVGLAGLAGIVEALRRKEKSARQFAESKLNVAGKT